MIVMPATHAGTTTTNRMSTNSTHCAALVREADRDRYLASLFAPALHRDALLSL